jgi:hypothetical protein
MEARFSGAMNQMKSWIASGMLLFGAVASGYSQGITSDVLRAQVSIQGAIQFQFGTNGTIHPVIILSQDLINLATGQPLGTKIPKNEVLAYASSPLTNNSLLFVYDLISASNLATIGEIDPVQQIFQNTMGGNNPSNTEAISQMTVQQAGTPTNGLLGGTLILDGKSMLDSNSEVKSFNAKMIGVLNTSFLATITNLSVTNDIYITNMNRIVTNSIINTNVFIGVTNIPVLVRSATMTTQGGSLSAVVGQ